MKEQPPTNRNDTMSLDPCTELQAVLHRDVPLTRAMGLHVLDWQGGRLRLGAPPPI